MALIRGRGLGLELMMAGSDFDSALAELRSKLEERPGFYRGSPATAVVGPVAPSDAQLEELRTLLVAFEIEFRGVEQAGEELARRRAMRPKRETHLSDSAKSLVADFAGARADIAERRKRGETSVRRVVQQAKPELPLVTVPAAAALAPPPPGTHYHVGTLRGGQALHNVGNIVVVGDVNPGTELVATGDIIVFGRLLGVAHAGAQGDETARVYALALQATQLRIASCIAVDEETRSVNSEPEVAFVKEGRIVIAPFSKVAEGIA
jgi:septum site-determining protein MinC